jgi:hypothetical protein
LKLELEPLEPLERDLGPELELETESELGSKLVLTEQADRLYEDTISIIH